MNNKIVFLIPVFATFFSAAYPQIALSGNNVPGHPPLDHKVTNRQATLEGTLLETMDTGGYTYVKINKNEQVIWAAGPVTAVKIGDKVSFSAGMPMLNFHSKSLGRDFDTLYFVGHFMVNDEKGVSSSNANVLDPHKKPTVETVTPLKSFSKAQDGQTIAEALQSVSADKKVQVRGQVSKFTASVMGKNWIHIRDSSTDKDLTITTDATVEINDIIVIDGKIALNKDFGYGYVYDVIVEDAKVTKEN